MKKACIIFSLLMAVAALMCFAPAADASSSFFSANCQSCHSVSSTCNGCHGHGTHPSSAKNSINIAGTMNKTTYAPGETVTVTVTGGYRNGWVRAILYDQNMRELARSTGPTGEGGGAGFPITLSAPAPTAAGTYTWNVAWYGNQYDLAEVVGRGPTVFGPRWTPDPNNPGHGQEIVSMTAFTVSAPPPAPQAKITLTPVALNFGAMTANTSAMRTAQIGNTGNADLIVSAINRCAQTSTEYTWSTPTAAPITIPAGGAASLTVTYAPIDAGTDAGCLSISSNDPAAPTTSVSLSGSATVPPAPQAKISVAPATLDFGTITANTSAARTAQIGNTGNADLIVSAINRCVQTSTEYTWSTQTAAPLTIPSGGTVTLTVSYAPAAAGTDLGCLSISSNDPATPTVAVNVTGIATAPPVALPSINLTPASADFGTVLVGSSATRSAQIGNTGTADLIISAINRCSQTSSEFAWSPTTTPITVPAGGSTTLSVTYNPSDAGNDAGCLTIASNDPATSSASLNLTANGSVPGTETDLDIVRFTANYRNGDDDEDDEDSVVRFRLTVANRGTLDGSAPAKLVGVSGAAEVYNQTITVSAAAGENAKFRFPPYRPTSRGTIVWTVTVTDPTPDTATATTRVRTSNSDDEHDD